MSSGICELCQKQSCECISRVRAKIKKQEVIEIYKTIQKEVKLLPPITIKGSRDGIWRRKKGEI